jgi:hypothetical protein
MPARTLGQPRLAAPVLLHLTVNAAILMTRAAAQGSVMAALQLISLLREANPDCVIPAAR